MSASLIGRFLVKRFQTIHQCRVDVACGLALLFGIGTRPLYGTYLVKKFKKGSASFFFHQFRCSIWKSVSSSPPGLRSPGGFERDCTLAGIGMAIRGEPACGRDQSRHNLVSGRS